MLATVSYKEFKNQYEGFETSKSNYNAAEKTIEIEINNNVYEMLQGKDKASLLLNELAIFNLSGREKEFVLVGSAKVEEQYNSNKEAFEKAGRAKEMEKAIATMKKYNI